MCGICGKLNLVDAEPISRDSIKQMMHAMRHRGPDDEGEFIEKSVGLGFRRLSIIDLETGHQPMTNEDESKWIVFNGEIYNHLELRKELQARGHRYRTQSDTETILHLYDEEGIDGFNKLNGMFGLAIWDGKRERLVLARDRAGKKPLYYAIENGTLYFGSEIKSLFAGGLKNRSVDSEALSDFLTFLFVPGPKTMFKSVRKLLPGHALIVEAGKMSTVKYWDLTLPGEGEFLSYNSRQDYVDEFSDLLEDAVRMRLISDVPLGAFLSGGLDSGSIVALMAKHSSSPVKTFSVGYKPMNPDVDRYDERQMARVTARYLGTDHHEVEVSPDDLSMLPDIVWHLDEPMADISILPTFKVSELARRHVTVSLSGDGSDEMLLGYGKHTSELMRGKYLSIPSFLRRGIIEPAVAHFPSTHWKVRKFKKALSHVDAPFAERAFSLFSVFTPDVKEEVLTQSVLTSAGGYSSLSVIEDLIREVDNGDTVNLISYLDFKTRLVDQLLLKLDKVSMAVGLECRAPFLDYRLLEYVVKVPPHIRLHLLKKKYLLKEAARQWLPDEVLNRKKKGFGVPIAAWLKYRSTNFFHEILLDDGTTRRGYFNRVAVEKMLLDSARGEHYIADNIIILTFFELWCRAFLDGDVNA